MTDLTPLPSDESTPSPAAKYSRFLRFLVTLFALGSLAYLLSQQGWDKTLASIKGIAPWRLASGVILVLISRVVVAFRWHVLLRAAKVPITPQQSTRISFAGLFASNFLPTTIGGDVFRLAMAFRLGYDRVTITASLVVDRLVGMAGMGTAALFGLGPLFNGMDKLLNTAEIGMSLLPLTRKFGGKFQSVFKRLWDSIQLWVKAPSGLLQAYLFTWVHMVCMFGISWLMLGGMGEHISFWLVAGLWSFTYFVTLIPISISGLGLQELSMTVIFSALGGVPAEKVAVAALLVRTLQLLGSLPGVLFISDITGYQKQK